MGFSKSNWAMFSAFYPFRGGISQFSERLCKELQKDLDVTKYTFRTQYPTWLFPGKTQYQTEAVLQNNVPAQRILSTFNPFSYWKALKILKSQNPEVFISHQWMSFFAPFQMVLSKGLTSKTKRIAIVHNLIPHEKRFLDRILIKLFLSSFDNYIVLSDHVRTELLDRKPTANVKLLEHPWYDHFGDTIESELAKEKLGINTEKKTLLFFGLIRHYKGLDILLQAFSELEDTYLLIIVGEVYGDKDWLDQLIKENKNKERILVVNEYVPDEHVSLYFSAAECVVLPYRSATQSGVTAIAHYFHRPVVATNVGALPSAIGADGCGVLCEPENPSDLKRAIEKCFELNRDEISAAIQKRKDRYSWSTFSSDLQAFVKECN